MLMRTSVAMRNGGHNQIILQQGYKRDLETISNSIGRMTNLKS